jgi:acyl-CoA synthetase (AMP-forming)/AMP-acid ligase II
MNPFAGKTYGEAIGYLAETFGNREALQFEGRSYSFADIKQQADQAAARLAALGLPPGSKIAIWMPNRPEFIWYWFGAVQAGLVAVFLNTRLRRDEFVYQIAQSDSAVVIVPGRPAFRDFLGELVECCPELATRPAGQLNSRQFPSLRAVVVCDQPAKQMPGVLDWSSATSLPAPQSGDDPDAPALIAYSSGTTALPKGAMLSHCIWRKAYDGGTFLGLSDADCLYLCVPLFGVLGSLNGILTFWSHGARIILNERFDVDHCLPALVEERCTAIHLLPAMIDALIAHPQFASANLERLRTGVVLSSDPAILRRAALELGVGGIVTGFGLTETTGLVTRCRWDEPLENRLASQGRPLPDCYIRVVDPETGADLPHGGEGEIWIGGYSVMLGYYNKPEETARTITGDGWLRSGDLGVLNPDGTLKFLRRIKDGYKHKGFNVSTPEVERVAAQYPGVAAVAVVGIPDPRHGEVGVAFVIPRKDAEFSSDAFLAFLGERLASFKMPAHVFAVDAFPVTGGTEKIQKFELRNMALRFLEAGSTVQVPRSAAR